ncbi:hypothetical protein DH2020_023395 [Rehmannia glutinosa]|uniref:PCI domain-containing protein n=1 Tax=Rehmannia glutinosa TaxID=99300 RepID=A0ABR0W6R5_REHGL
MDIEEKQAEHIEFFVKQASSLKGAVLAGVVVEATSHPSLFAFSEILAVPNVLELEGTDNSIFLDLLRMFAHGTWSEYKSARGARPNASKRPAQAHLGVRLRQSARLWALEALRAAPCVASRLPHLVPDQVLKLKQLTVLTLAETNKNCLDLLSNIMAFAQVLPYDMLMQELDVSNVRELEDFLINDCMYVGIVRGKLDQLRRCFEVQFAAGRDLRPGQLGSMIQVLANWLTTSDNLLVSIQEKIKWADNMAEMDKKHRKEIDERVEEVKKTLSLKADIDFRGHEEIFSEHGGVMDYEQDRSRPKSLALLFDLNNVQETTSHRMKR